MGRTDPLKPCRHEGSQPPLSRAELPVDTVALARYLIGKILVREMAEGVASGRIVETEAYVVGDAAGHAYRGITPRNRALFLEHGHAYVYLAYGTAYMLNVSSETAGIGAGVLIRALEPRDGIPIMQRNRRIERLRDLARGPGRLAAALRVDRRLRWVRDHRVRAIAGLLGKDRAHPATRAGYEVSGVFKETASGAKLERAERRKVMALAQRREIDAVW